MDKKTFTLVCITLTFLAVISFTQGKEPSSKLILNGTLAKIEDLPYVATILSLRSIPSDLDTHISTCGASILNEHWIITAYHCIFDRRITAIKARVGLDMITQYGETYDVDFYVGHPNYNQTSREHDLCLLKLSEPLVFNDKVKAAVMATSQDDKAYNTALIAAFGSNGTTSPVLRLTFIEMQIYKGRRRCIPDYYVHATDICMKSNTKKPAPGDSGSGIIAKTNDKSLIFLGVVSGSVKLHKGVNYASGPRISNYASWIREVMNKH